ncbi:MAG: N-acetylglucosamine kinase-like BadF-type ATPase [Bradymonadia bacterium]|jgi:N-acetylglucosamine kinase-like BadF-type ATPase
MKAAAIGMDVGGTKTAGALVSAEGEVLARTSGGPGNYQETGVEEAERVYVQVASALRRSAHELGYAVAASGWGISGWDRPKDETALLPALRAADGLPDSDRIAANDTFLLLRGAALDGHGIGVVSGTGSNCVGIAPDGSKHQIGGLGFEFGDGGGGGDIGRSGMRAAFRGASMRGPKTLLTELLMDRYDLERLDDLLDHFIADADIPLSESVLAPIVFDAATLGDPVATSILESAGREMALSVRVLARGAYAANDEFALVLGGSVLQRAENPTMRNALIADVHDEFQHAVPIRPSAPPLLGALLFGLDALARSGHCGTPVPATSHTIARQLHEVS